MGRASIVSWLGYFRRPSARLATCLVAGLLAGCGSSTPLPSYEPPIARTSRQDVRTTAYTDTESDHLAYGNHNALGGTLHAAAYPSGPPAGMSVMTAATPPGNRVGTAFAADPPPGSDANPSFQRVANVRPIGAASPDGSAPTQRFLESAPTAPAVPAPALGSLIPSSGVGSAAADWSRWPAGTIFRLESTGQVYEVDDYGWALAGRNTIDLYQPTRSAMNSWGVRHEPIEILCWGDPAESLRKLRNHQDYRHIKRMVLELEGHARAAAALR